MKRAASRPRELRGLIMSSLNCADFNSLKGGADHLRPTILGALLAVSLLGPTSAVYAKDKPATNGEATKSSNINAASKLNNGSEEKQSSKNKSTKTSGSSSSETTSTGEKSDGKKDKLGGASALTDTKSKEDAKKTADVVNQVPGVKVDQKDLEPPTAPPIKGFHPIKRLLRPVENLEGMSIKLEQQIMKLEGPIAGLQPPMINLQHKMDKVDQSIGTMQDKLGGVQSQVTGVRSDIALMRKDIEGLKAPIVALKAPIGTVAQPLEKLQSQLNFIILAIFVAAGAIAFGTPVAAVLMYRNRHKLFPDMQTHELPEQLSKVGSK